MSIYEAIGMAWVIFTSALATVAILYLALIGIRTMVRKQIARDDDIDIKEMFKVAR